MNRALVIAVAAGMIAGCSTPRIEEFGVVDVGRPPAPLRQARVVEIDGQLVKAELSRTRFVLEAGSHSLVVVDATAAHVSPEDLEALPRFSVHVEAGRHHFLALQSGNGGRLQVVIWQVEPLEAGTAPAP